MISFVSNAIWIKQIHEDFMQVSSLILEISAGITKHTQYVGNLPNWGISTMGSLLRKNGSNVIKSFSNRERHECDDAYQLVPCGTESTQREEPYNCHQRPWHRAAHNHGELAICLDVAARRLSH